MMENMNEQETYYELAIGDISRRLTELQEELKESEWSTRMALLDEHRLLVEKLCKFYSDEAKRFIGEFDE